MNQHAKRRHQAGLAREAEREKPERVKHAGPPLATPEEGRIVYEITAEETGQRLDRALAQRAEAEGLALSRTRIRALIEDGLVSIDGRQASDPGAKLREGQSVSLDVPAASDPEPLGEAIPLSIVFEDEHLLVIDKPAGLVVHPASGHETGTLVNALIAHCGDSLSGIGGVRRPGIVHRLDKDTSGLLVVAKTDAAHQGLSMLFADHGRTLSLTREYLAFVWGRPDRAGGTIDAPIGRHQHQREKMAVVRHDQGREAITHWRIQEGFVSGTAPVSLIACRLETGRTHQIRVHMAHIGHPLLGDPVYGTGFKTKANHLTEAARAALESLHRQALHAGKLGFTHPVTGEELMFESNLPADLASLAEILRAPKMTKI
ncbi:MAG: RluA family pseudouridine synthase [Hyphomicrobiales bacterium]|nr:RluA family pseudouridine synthase [Hyphomicrobiales bacterium]